MNLNELTIEQCHKGLKEKEFSSVDLTKACLQRISDVDEKLNAFVTVTENVALKQAEEVDKKIAKGEQISPLTGIPCSLKDVFSTKGIETTACSNILKGYVPPADASTVKKLKNEGMVLLGKTNTDEFTCGTSTESSCFGPTRTPWDLERVAGGSSGGPAASIASHECIYGLGTDTGGSIRLPGAYCGIPGLKVSYGRVSRSGVISMASSLDSIGPMGKTVRDCAIILQTIAGKDVADSTTPDIEVPDYLSEIEKDVKGMTVGVPKEYFIKGLDDEIKQSVDDAVKQFEKLGMKVKEVSLPHTKYALAVYYVICPCEVSANMARYDGIRFGPGPKESADDLMDYYVKARSQGFGDELKRRIMTGTYALSSGYYDAYYLKAQKVRSLVIKDYEEAFKEVDVMVAPIAPDLPFKVGEKVDDPLKLYLVDVLTTPVSVVGIPSLAVPSGVSKDNLPIGFQIIGPRFKEERVLQVGNAYEKAIGFREKYQPTL